MGVCPTPAGKAAGPDEEGSVLPAPEAGGTGVGGRTAGEAHAEEKFWTIGNRKAVLRSEGVSTAEDGGSEPEKRGLARASDEKNLRR